MLYKSHNSYLFLIAYVTVGFYNREKGLGRCFHGQGHLFSTHVDLNVNFHSHSLGKVRHGRLSYNPSPGQQRQADHEDSLPGQPPYLKVVMERVVEEKSASAVAFRAASQWESLSQGNKMERVEKITLILLWPPHSHAWVHTPACTKWVCYTWGELEGGEIEMTKKEQNQEW